MVRWEELSRSYDQVAGRYQQEFQDELQAKPPAIKATKQIESPVSDDGADERKGADVVALDAFRKK